MDKQIEMNISDAIIEKAVRFGIGKRKYSIYPPTLGKTQILKNLYIFRSIPVQKSGVVVNAYERQNSLFFVSVRP